MVSGAKCFAPTAIPLRRCAAFSIDALCAAVPLFILATLGFADLGPGETADSRDRLIVIFASILGTVFAVQIGMFARSHSVGKALLRLRVVTAEGRRAGFLRTLARWVIRLLATWGMIPLIVTMPVLAVEAVLFYRRGWTCWDMALGTQVIWVGKAREELTCCYRC